MQQIPRIQFASFLRHVGVAVVQENIVVGIEVHNQCKRVCAKLLELVDLATRLRRHKHGTCGSNLRHFYHTKGSLTPLVEQGPRRTLEGVGWRLWCGKPLDQNMNQPFCSS